MERRCGRCKNSHINKQAAIAEGILACPKEIKDGATSVVLNSVDGCGRINFS